MPDHTQPAPPLDEGNDMLDALADGVVLADEYGVVTAVNSAAAVLLKVDDAVGKQLADVVVLQDRDGNDWFTCTDPYSGSELRSGLTEQVVIR